MASETFAEDLLPPRNPRGVRASTPRHAAVRDVERLLPLFEIVAVERAVTRDAPIDVYPADALDAITAAGYDGLRVVSVLEAADQSLAQNGQPVNLGDLS